MWTWVLLAVVYFSAASLLAKFEALPTKHYMIDKKTDFIYKIYIELSLIWDQSQLSSSIHLEMASKTKWGWPRDPAHFPRDLAALLRFPYALAVLRFVQIRIGVI